MQPHDHRQLSNEGPNVDEIELIGIELAVTSDTGREVELEVHGIKRTMPYPRYNRQLARITIHTSNGDITSNFPLKPGNYYVY